MRRTFISYAHNQLDRAVARQLYGDLVAAGHAPWLDEKDLLPGEDWASRIRQEILECRHFVALLSSRSLNKRGFVQKELRMALDVLETIPIDERFLIPLRLDSCYPKDERLAKLHWADLFPDYDDGLGRLFRTLKATKVLPGRLWIDVGVEVPPDTGKWSDEELFPYIRTVLIPEARERAQRDYEYVPIDQADEAIRVRTEEKLLEVAARFGFLDGLRCCLEQQQRGAAG
jgi:hypothetical protein